MDNIQISPVDVTEIVRAAVAEYLDKIPAEREAGYQAQLVEERRLRFDLEKRIQALVDDNRRAREEKERRDAQGEN